MRDLGKGLLPSPAPGPQRLPGSFPHDRGAAGCPCGPLGPDGASCLLGAAVLLWHSAVVWGCPCLGPHVTARGEWAPAAEQLGRRRLESSGPEGWPTGQRSAGRASSGWRRRPTCGFWSCRLLTAGTLGGWLQRRNPPKAHSQGGTMSPDTQASTIAIQRAAYHTGWKKPGWGAESAP